MNYIGCVQEVDSTHQVVHDGHHVLLRQLDFIRVSEFVFIAKYDTRLVFNMFHNKENEVNWVIVIFVKIGNN